MSQRPDPPNGIPYADIDGTKIGTWDDGGFNIRVRREDGENLVANLTLTQLKLLIDAAERAIEASDGPRCVRCEKPITGEVFAPVDDGGPMHQDCFLEYVDDHE